MQSISVIDLLILILIAWLGILGWKRGGVRSLIDTAGIGSAIAVVLFSIPLVKDGLIDGDWAFQFRNWIGEHFSAVPTGVGFATNGHGEADRLFHLLIVGGSAFAVWIGLQMVLQVFQTVWTIPEGAVLSRISGMLIGVGIGSMISAYMVQCLGLLSWVEGFETIDLYISHSLFVWLIKSYVI